MAKRDKYRVVRKIDAGGMAEVFQGVAESIEGFTKRVAIKRVLPHLAENKKFLAMFLDEARLSLRMNHANVVHVFDIGQAGGTYFIVMEFVDGTDVKKLMETMRKRGTRVPLELAIFIIMEVCRGLAYAHELEDADGNNLNIVHRDVSPPNILLSKQGEVKIVDFGLAKATSQLEHTDPGVVKGKFAYLAPEAAWGRKVDRRADVFACGIILFELLTGKRLFLGENDVKTVELVRLGEVPPMAELNPDIKPELEGIVRKALAQNEHDRFQTCDEMAEELASYLFSQRLKVTGFDLRRLVEGLVKEKEKEEAGAPRPSIIDQLIQEELGRFASLGEEEDEGAGPVRVEESSGGRPLNPLGFEDPRAWEEELEVGGSDSPLPVTDEESGWRESGLYKRDSIVSEDGGSPQSEVPLDHVSLAQMLEGEVRLGSEAPPPEGGGAVKGVLIGVAVFLGILAVATGVAFAMGWIP